MQLTNQPMDEAIGREGEGSVATIVCLCSTLQLLGVQKRGGEKLIGDDRTEKVSSY